MVAIKHKTTGEVLGELSDDPAERRDLSGTKLAGGDFSLMDLSNVDFHNADLSDATFIGANLEGANLQAAILIRAKLDKAKLSQAKLTDVIANSDSMIEVEMFGATCRYGKFRDADMAGARVQESDMSMTDLRCNLNNANLSSADLRGADLRGANLSGADLRLANLFEAKITDARMSRTLLQGAVGPHGKRIGGGTATSDGAAGARRKTAKPWWNFWG